MKEAHLKKLHLRLASDAIADAKHHAALHKHYGKLAESFGKSEMADTHEDAGECLQKIADAHHAKSEHHTDEATFHANCAKGLHDGASKAAGIGDDLDELMPTDVRGVVSDAPNVRPVFRTGQREFGKADVPEQFRKLVSVNDEEE
jgi:hypothetical protein